jgi:hypothetical protein
MKKKSESINDIPLIPQAEFQEKLKQILNVSKEESDKQIAELQVSNAHHRAHSGQQKRGRKPTKKS